MENSITFLGVRGSIPVSGEAYRRYGCATTCYLIELDGETILVDAGNGILNLPEELLGRPEITMILSHPHLDHLMGLPMCPYLFRKGATLHMYAAVRGGMDAEAQVDALVAPPLWPVGAESLPSMTCCLSIAFIRSLISDGQSRMMSPSLANAQSGMICCNSSAEASRKASVWVGS